MKIAVIGATGYVGSATVKELASRGHEVIAIARNTEKVEQNNQVKAVATDVHSAEFVELLRGVDAVVSAYNAGWTNPNIAADFTKGYDSILSASKEANVPYLLVVGGAGSLFVAPEVQLIDTPQFPKEIFDGANAARNLLNDLRERKDVNWSFVSPPAMLGVTANYSEERTGKYRLGKDNLLMNGEVPAGISVADFAIALADDVEQKAHLHQRFTVAH